LAGNLASAGIVELVSQARAYQSGDRCRNRKRHVRVNQKARELGDNPAQVAEDLPKCAYTCS
jgi:hypothetical protein